MKIRRKDITSRDPYWKLASFKRVHKSKKTYTRKKKLVKVELEEKKESTILYKVLAFIGGIALSRVFPEHFWTIGIILVLLLVSTYIYEKL